jgi:uncharacterized protein YdaU (DUF1376 family)
MNKAPAFQFYAADFLTDTSEMTCQEVGAYIRLLSLQWVNGGLSSDPMRLANIIGADFHAVWDGIKHKFSLCDDGKLRNPKLEQVRDTQIAFRNKQSESGKLGASNRWAKEAAKSNKSTANSESMATPPSTDGDPISDPNGENIALRSSSSSSSLSLSPTSTSKTNKTKTLVPTPEGVSTATWNDFQTLRKSKKAPVTAAAMDGIKREAEKAGWTLENALIECCSRGWTGFKSEWVSENKQNRQQPETIDQMIDRSSAQAERVRAFLERTSQQPVVTIVK